MKKIWHYLRFDWPIHFLIFFTNWLPDNVIFLRLRGMLLRPFFGSCGKDLRVGRNCVFYNPRLINLGSHIYIAFGGLIMATTNVVVEDEVMFGPYCVVSTGNHTSVNGSFRFGSPIFSPIAIGKGSWVGSHVVITPGCEVGKNSLIAAGAVVTENIPSNVIAGGVPAKIIKHLTEDQA